MANRITTTLEAINGGLDYALLTEKADFFDYENGRRGDSPAGTRLSVALQGGGRLTPLTVKFIGKDPLPNVDDSAIANAVANMQYPYIRLKSCTVNIYTVDGRMGFTATAEAAELVDFSKSK